MHAGDSHHPPGMDGAPEMPEENTREKRGREKECVVEGWANGTEAEERKKRTKKKKKHM